jgi:NAD(P)-dependent dehydrogenase (short-subunit alcohol dehydrogenase family)
MLQQDCKAIITGGASGLGEACATAIVAAGGSVTMIDLNQERGEAKANELGERARFVRADVTSEEEVQRAIDGHIEAFGGLNAAINCAGVATPGRVLQKDGSARPLENFAKVININLIGTFNVLRLAAAAMGKNDPNAGGERGVIVNTASVAAFDGQIGQAAYSASKGAVAAMTLPVARDLSKLGIRVMCIAPGIFGTPMMAGLPEKVQASLAEQVPFPPRLGNPSEFAQLVTHILENTMLNGEVIRLDGALRMGPR